MEGHSEDRVDDGFLQSGEVKTGYVRGIPDVDDFVIKEVQYVEVEGQAVFEGCILLGKVEQMEALRAEVDQSPGLQFLRNNEAFGLTVLPRKLWPKGIMHYRIDPALPEQQRVRDAMKHWTDKTDIEFVERTSQSNYVTFKPSTGCAAHTGRQGGEQLVLLGPGCSTGNTIHEIGHALGLWHEQGRSDRDRYVTVRTENVADGKLHNFDQHIHDGIDRGGYDYGSIMHYGTHFFSKNGKPTIETKNGQAIGQRNALSAGDIAAIAKAYSAEFAKR